MFSPPIRPLLAALLLTTSALYANPGDTDTPQPVQLPPPESLPAASLTLHTSQGPVRLSFSELEQLPTYQVTTTTFWPEDDGSYAGPLLADLLKQGGLEQSSAIRVRARDGFSQVIPRQDWERWPMLLATRRDGQVMSTRNKGPYRIIYPRNLSPELAEPIYRLRWVWLVQSIAVEPGL